MGEEKKKERKAKRKKSKSLLENVFDLYDDPKDAARCFMESQYRAYERNGIYGKK